MNKELEDQVAEASFPCLICGKHWPADRTRCPTCSYGADEIALYNPKHFLLMAVFFSGFVPLWLAGLNWRRLNQQKKANLAMFGGVASFVLVFSFFAWLPEEMGGNFKILGYAINLPIGLMVKSNQYPLYQAWRIRGAKGAGSAGQMFLAFGIAIMLALACAMPVIFYMESRVKSGTELLVEGNYEAADRAFREVLERDSRDIGALYGAAYAAAGQGKWSKVEEYLNAYMLEVHDDAAAIAMMGLVARSKGDEEAAARYFKRAEGLMPGVVQAVTKMFYKEISSD